MTNKMTEALETVNKALAVPTQALGLDLDGTIDENPQFFSLLSRFWPGKVYVITYRSDGEKAKRDVEGFGVRCDEVVLVKSFPEKAEVITRLNIGVYFDDMDEVIVHISENCTVMKVRNGGNFDAGKWLYSDKTGQKV